VPHLAGDQTIGAKPTAMPRDAEMAEMLSRAGKEAQEAIHHHRSQLLMWERVQAAAHAGIAQLHADEAEQAYGGEQPSMPEGRF
jgi:CHASE2 domain-containing sensor protein